MPKSETWGKGLLFLQILRQSYKIQLHRADLLKKEKEYSLPFQTPSKTINDFAARCIQLCNLLVENGVSTSVSGLRDRFLMGLCPLFTEIQQTSYEDRPLRWQTDDIQTLINITVSYKDEKLAVRERNRLFNETNRTVDKKPKPEDSNKDTKKPSNSNSSTNRQPQNRHSNPEQSWQEENCQRQARVEDDIKNGIFDPMKYAWEVRPRCCV